VKKLVVEKFHKYIKVFGKNTHKENLRLHNQTEERIFAEKREGLSVVKKKERRSKRVYSRIDKEEVYKTNKVTTDSTSIFYGKEEWKEKNSLGLLISQ